MSHKAFKMAVCLSGCPGGVVVNTSTLVNLGDTGSTPAQDNF